MRSLLHQMFHWLTSRWIPDVWYAGPILCETRTCMICLRSQFRSKNDPDGPFSAWIESGDNPARTRCGN